MFIGLSELELHDIRFDVDIPAGQIDYGGKITQSSPLHAAGTAQLISPRLGEIRIRGRLSGKLDALCDRCLEPATATVDRDFDWVYMPAEGPTAGGEDEVDADALEVGFYEGSGLQLNDVVREVVLLGLPMRLVCSEECKGICPACGQNRNLVECGCHPEPLDDRWNQLKALRK